MSEYAIQDVGAKVKNFASKHPVITGLGALLVVGVPFMLGRGGDAGPQALMYQEPKTPSQPSSPGSDSGGVDEMFFSLFTQAFESQQSQWANNMSALDAMNKSILDSIGGEMAEQWTNNMSALDAMNKSILASIGGQMAEQDKMNQAMLKALGGLQGNLSVPIDQLQQAAYTPYAAEYYQPDAAVAAGGVNYDEIYAALARDAAETQRNLAIIAQGYDPATGATNIKSSGSSGKTWTDSSGKSSSGSTNAPTGTTTYNSSTGKGTASDGSSFSIGSGKASGSTTVSGTYNGQSGSWNKYGEFKAN